MSKIINLGDYRKVNEVVSASVEASNVKVVNSAESFVSAVEELELYKGKKVPVHTNRVDREAVSNALKRYIEEASKSLVEEGILTEEQVASEPKSISRMVSFESDIDCEDEEKIEIPSCVRSENSGKLNVKKNKANDEIEYTFNNVTGGPDHEVIKKKKSFSDKSKKVVDSVKGIKFNKKAAAVAVAVSVVTIAGAGVSANMADKNNALGTVAPVASVQAQEGVKSVHEQFNESVAGKFGAAGAAVAPGALPPVIEFTIDTEMEGNYSKYAVKLKVSLDSKNVTISNGDGTDVIDYKMSNVQSSIVSIDTSFDASEVAALDAKASKKLAKAIIKEKKSIEKDVLKELKTESGQALLKGSINEEIKKFF